MCSAPPDLTEYGKTCLKNMGGAWLDGIKSLWSSPVTPAMIARQKYFESCFSETCKKETLGSALGLFSAVEISGHRDQLATQHLDPKICDQSYETVARSISIEKIPYYCGASAASLYRMIPKRLGDSQTYTEPWPGGQILTGQEMRQSLSLQNMLDGILKKQLGLLHPECFDPLVLAQLRCYAVFTVVDPMIAAGMAAKAFEAVKLVAEAAGTLQKVGKAEEGQRAFRVSAAGASHPPGAQEVVVTDTPAVTQSTSVVRAPVVAATADKVACAAGPCPDWVEHFTVSSSTEKHVEVHSSDTDPQAAALEAVKEKIRQYQAANPDKPLSRADVEKMIRDYNNGDKNIFRRQNNTFYPPGTSFNDVVSQIRQGKTPLQMIENGSDLSQTHYVASMKVNGADVKFNVYICAQPTCQVWDQLPQGRVHRDVHKGEMITLYPECGPGVKYMTGYDRLAKVLRDNPNAPMSSLIQDKPCP